MTGLDEAIAAVRGGEDPDLDLPEEGGDLTFEAPWQARAFAVVVTLARQGRFEWNEFQARLIEEIRNAETEADADANGEAAYYEHWIAAAEDLLREGEVVSGDELRARTEAFESGERDASEFVVGVDHAHTHDENDVHTGDDAGGGGSGDGRDRTRGPD